MKKYNSTIIALVIFVVMILFVIIFSKSFFKTTYICTDTTNNVEYTFDTEDEMNSFCDNLSIVDDSSMSSNSIYYDLINNNDKRFSFYPYLDSNNNFTIITVIVDCNNPNEAKNDSIEWFRKHSYNINDYKIEYEYPCE